MGGYFRDTPSSLFYGGQDKHILKLFYFEQGWVLMSTVYDFSKYFLIKPSSLV